VDSQSDSSALGNLPPTDRSRETTLPVR